MDTADGVWSAALDAQRALNVQVIPGESNVCGIAVVGSQVFVVRHKASHIESTQTLQTTTALFVG